MLLSSEGLRLHPPRNERAACSACPWVVATAAGWNLNEAELPWSLDHYQSELITGEERSVLIHCYSPLPSSEVRSSL